MNGKTPKRPNENGPDDDNDMSMSKVVRNVLVWLCIIVLVVLTTVLFTKEQNPNVLVTIPEYQNLVDQGLIKDAVIRKDQSSYDFSATLKSEVAIQRETGIQKTKRIRANLLNVNSHTEEVWKSKGISFSYESDNTTWVVVLQYLPWMILIVGFFFLMRRMQSGSSGGRNIFSFNKSRARMLADGNTKVTFSDVAGAEEAKDELKEIVDFLRDPTKYTRLGGKIPKGVLLLGPPGTGKTLLARAVAGEAGVPFFSISGADFVEMFVGVGASRVRDLFEQAQKSSPCIVFIDEIDAVGRQRGAGLGGGHDEREQTLNQLLVEMDGFEQNAGIIIIAATNRPDVLDPALLRPGRFDRHVVVDRPDIAGRKGILIVHTRKVPVAKDVNLDILSKATPGFSGADIANLVNEAALYAARRSSNEVTMFDFENAIDKVMMGAERKSMIIGPKEKESTAYHEIGHALAGMLLPYSDPVHKVTIIPRGRALGVTSYLPNEDTHTANRDQLLTRLITLMAGRAAEMVVFNHFNSGASNDLERATNIAKKMVCEWGMSEVIGPVRYASQHDEVFLGREMGQPRDHSEETARAIDSEVRRILMEASSAAEQFMRDNIHLLHRLSKSLIERETLDASELQILINGGELPAVVKDVQAFRDKMRNAAPTTKDKDRPTGGTEGLALSPS